METVCFSEKLVSIYLPNDVHTASQPRATTSAFFNGFVFDGSKKSIFFIAFQHFSCVLDF
jgi:hypothetical protein